jgi:osmoprotectant transport system ATP-binding protein
MSNNGARPVRGASLRFESVTVKYPSSPAVAVNGVSLDIPAGALVVILGPSGCGKSTLLRTVNRLVEPQDGAVFINDRNVRDENPNELRRHIGYVIQAVGLFSHMTVAQNIAVVPQLLHWEAARVRTRVDELLSLVRLDPKRYRDRYPHELSGGEQQRVGVIRALAAEPPLLLMDEPFGAVDALVRTVLQDETRRIQQALGTTFLFVTHDVEEALRIADRIVIMQHGKIVQYDEPLRILSRPASPYVERLLETHDSVRRLALLCVRDALEPVRDAINHPVIAIDATLREALSVFLHGADVLDVRDGERRAGSLTFEALRRAMRNSAN